MLPSIKLILAYVGGAAIVGAAILFAINSYPAGEERTFSSSDNTIRTAQTSTPLSIRDSAPLKTSSPEVEHESVVTVAPKPSISPGATSIPAPVEEQTAIVEEMAENKDEIARIQDPYSFPPHSFETVNTEVRAALVNIACSMGVQGGLRNIVASGIVIDTRGVILTNAHVAQYVLLSQSPDVHVSCTVGTGSPTRPLWSAEIVYVPPVWIKVHAEDIIKQESTGTGEHDYALLRVTSALDGSPLPAAFPFLPPDTREGIGFPGDTVLAASYPAEFIKESIAQSGLYPLTSIAAVQELLTFNEGTVDLISIGGTAGAQGGSSGGGVINAWGRLIGIITTTSEGNTTAERDLRAVSLNYINRDLTAQTGSNLTVLLAGDIATKAATFNATEAPSLIELLTEELSR